MRDLSLLPDLELALIQTTLAWQDPAANRAHFESLLAQARGADLILLPEMFSTGFSMDSTTLAEPEDGPTSQWLREQAQALQAVITGSLIIQAADGSYRNRLLWARPDGSVAHYDKRHLFRMAGEHKHYSAGTEQVLLEVNGWQVRPLICYDLRFPVWSRDPQTSRKAPPLEPTVAGAGHRKPVLSRGGKPHWRGRQGPCLQRRQPGAGFSGRGAAGAWGGGWRIPGNPQGCRVGRLP